jgi:hypothetical protein
MTPRQTTIRVDPQTGAVAIVDEAGRPLPLDQLMAPATVGELAALVASQRNQAQRDAVAAAKAKVDEEAAKLIPIMEATVEKVRAEAKAEGAAEAIAGSRVRRLVERDPQGQIISTVEQRIPLPGPEDV